MLWVVLILTAAVTAALVRLMLLKRDIRRSGGELAAIAMTDTNARLTTDTFDKDVAAFAENVNGILDKNKRVLYEKVRAESDLKQAVSNISHDLRTPLTSASGYLQMLINSDVNDETKARYIATIKERLDALSVLMENLFEFAKIIEGRVTLDIEPVNAGSLLRDALSAAYPELAAAGFEVKTDIPDSPVIIYCDKNALLRIFQNLLKNACTHGHEYLRVTLSENGVEIANKVNKPEEIDTGKLFERFYTADASRTGKNAGLGLAIVRELTALMGGEISADIKGPLLVIRITI